MKKIILLAFLLLSFSLIFPRTIFAAKYTLDPSSKNIEVNEQFNVVVNLDTQGKEVSGVEAKLSFDKELMEVTQIDFSGIFPMNDQDINNGSGYVQFSSNMGSGVTNFNGSSNWVTLSLKGKAGGSVELRFSCSESGIYEYKTAVNLLDCSSLGLGTYTISEAGEPPPGDEGDGENGNGEDEEPPPGCSDASPNTPTDLQAVSGPGTGEVTLVWTAVSDIDYYSLVFGGASGAYEYGAANIGSTSRYEVKQLAPGKLYYFAVAAVKGCASSGFSSEASTRAKGATGGTPAKVTKGPTPTPPYQPIGEILPEVDFPSEEEAVTPTPIPIFEPEEGKPSPFRTILLILAFLFILIGLGFGLWKLIKGRRPPPPPEIVIPGGPTPTEPLSPPTQA